MKEDKLSAIRHSLAHLLATAVLEKYPGTKLAIGPAIDNGFYYDFEFPEGVSITPENLKELQKSMIKFINKELPFVGKEISADEAKKMFKASPYKLELIDEFEKKAKAAESSSPDASVEAFRDEKLTVYTSGDFTDLCRGGHVDNTKEIDPKSFKLTHIAGAYWRGNEKNKMLTRIYGLAFENKEKLDEYIARQEETKKRDHRKLGKELDLFYIDSMVGKGLPMWTPKGTAVKHALEEFTRKLEKKYGYEHVETPYIGHEELYKTSGHLEHYSENMYAPIDMDGDKFYLRAMACPHHIRLLMRKPISHHELPIRYAEIAYYNRYEKSGELMGMIRARIFELTDAHIFVSPEGLKDEFKQVVRLIQEGMKGLGFDEVISYRFSKRDPNDKEKYYPDEKLWTTAEPMMRDALDEIGVKYVEAEGEAAFYGPKLDIQARNVNGKEDTLFTAQIDFLLPEKFGVEYIDKDGKKKRPVMIHRSAIGSLERTFAFLIEHYAGAFPVWLSPVQVKVIPIADAHKEYAQGIFEKLKDSNVRVEIDDSNETFGKKVRNAKLEKVPLYIVIGDQEVKDNKVTVESRDKGKVGAMTVENFIDIIREKK